MVQILFLGACGRDDKLGILFSTNDFNTWQTRNAAAVYSKQGGARGPGADNGPILIDVYSRNTVMLSMMLQWRHSVIIKSSVMSSGPIEVARGNISEE